MRRAIVASALALSLFGIAACGGSEPVTKAESCAKFTELQDKMKTDLLALTGKMFEVMGDSSKEGELVDDFSDVVTEFRDGIADQEDGVEDAELKEAYKAYKDELDKALASMKNSDEFDAASDQLDGMGSLDSAVLDICS